MQTEIKHSWHFDQSPQEVWDYLTRPELLEQWLGKTDFQPVVGHKFHFVSPYGNHSYCEVLEVQPFTRLSYSWQKKSLKDNKPYDSIVEWALVPQKNGTELQLLHNGFKSSEDQMGHSTGWEGCLKIFIELIKTKNHEQGN